MVSFVVLLASGSAFVPRNARVGRGLAQMRASRGPELWNKSIRGSFQQFRRCRGTLSTAGSSEELQRLMVSEHEKTLSAIAEAKAEVSLEFAPRIAALESLVAAQRPTTRFKEIPYFEC